MYLRRDAPTGETMRAAVYERYGPPEVLEVADVEMPSVGRDQVLVEVRASAVTQGDRRLREADFPGFMQWFGRLVTGLFGPRNRVPGTNFAGRVVAVGEDVTRFAAGDDVFGAGMSGAYAEYVCVGGESSVARMPEETSYEQAADLPYSAGSAWNFLVERADVQPGESVLIVGAAGGVGRSAVQLAKHLGAEVTAVCRGDDADFVRRLGADRVIDYTTDDFTDRDVSYDVIFDTSGTTSFRACRETLVEDGRYLSLLISLGLLAAILWTRWTGGRRAMGGVAEDSREGLQRLADAVEQGAFEPVIDSRYPLAQIRDAHRRLEEGHPNGSVVVCVSGDSRDLADDSADRAEDF